MTRRYQNGSLGRVARKNGPDAWVYRWVDSTGVQKKKVIGDVSKLKTLKDATREIEGFKAQINNGTESIGRMTVLEAWNHFQQHELSDPDVDRSPTTIKSYQDYFKHQILPVWRDTALDDVKSVAVEKWLRSLTHAPATKAKIRNFLSALFNHCIRHELYSKLNPISTVRQSSVRERDPDTLTIEEIRSILDNIKPEALVVRVMVATDALSALRKSEMRGLKWADLDLEKMWFRLARGLVGKQETKLKTKASRKAIPMLPELAELLKTWRAETPYPSPEDWVFASPYTHGKWPYWPETAMADHIRPAAAKAGIHKKIGWHTFRHSFATLMGQRRESVKTVQELLRHASSKITQDVYQQGDADDMRKALGGLAGILEADLPR